jgi:hypothetical protein
MQRSSFHRSSLILFLPIALLFIAAVWLSFFPVSPQSPPANPPVPYVTFCDESEACHQKNLPYQNAALPIETRVTDLLSRMTNAEKIGQMALIEEKSIHTIEDEQGVSTSFVVRETRTYGNKDDASAIFQSNDGKAHLNLITCAGVWDKIAKMYSKRLVVFTDKVE